MELFLQVLLLAISGFGLACFGFFCLLALVGIGCSNTKTELKNGLFFLSLFFILLLVSLFCVIVHFYGASLGILGMSINPLWVSFILGLLPLVVFYILRRLSIPSAPVVG